MPNGRIEQLIDNIIFSSYLRLARKYPRIVPRIPLEKSLVFEHLPTVRDKCGIAALDNRIHEQQCHRKSVDQAVLDYNVRRSDANRTWQCCPQCDATFDVIPEETKRLARHIKEKHSDV